MELFEPLQMTPLFMMNEIENANDKGFSLILQHTKYFQEEVTFYVKNQL